ncbi:MAG: pentapeptide repeat-containing protein [Alphaproteobacteria bacterium]|nr:pentapeptide repeat-containing protein [Alphaproteobacteria bacterium]
MQLLDNRYQLGRLIGKGGVGEVYEGLQLALDRRVAIKVLRPELTARPDLVVRFEQEARTTCRLQHPNVVTVFDVGTTADGSRFLVMELLEGRTLAELLAEQGSLPVDRVLDIASQIVRGMGAGQGVGLVHRDLKPENIFLVRDEHVKILDFGLALLREGQARMPAPTSAAPPEIQPARATLVPGAELEETSAPTDDRTTWHGGSIVNPSPLRVSIAPPKAPSIGPLATPTASMHGVSASTGGSGGSGGSSPGSPRLTNPGALLGTPRYMSPEQAMGWSVDHRADLYAFGCILYEMVSGRPPFQARKTDDYLKLHMHARPRRLRRLVPRAPRALERVVMRLLEKDPSARYADWAALAGELRRIRGTTSVIGDAESSHRDRARPTEPYRFLQPFTIESRAIFFGRDGDARRFREQWEHLDRVPLVLLTGRSGVGKSSFLYARVMPGLEDTGHALLSVRGSSRPLSALALDVRRRLARGEDGEDSGDRPLPELLDLYARKTGRQVAVLLDQVEELFTTGTLEDQRAFQAGIAAVVGSGDRTARFILSLREDYLGQLLRTLDPLPVDALTRTMPLRPLQPPDIVEALIGPGHDGLPVDYRPFTYEAGLVDEIVQDLINDQAGEVAPRVQVVGYRLWELMKKDGANRITRAHYREGLGGAQGILGRILDDSIADLDLADRGAAKEMLRALTHLPGSATSAPQPESALLGTHADAARRAAVLRRLESPWRIILGYTDPRWPEERTYRIAHEALIARIQDYGEENHGRNRARQVFSQGLALWLRNGRQDQDLLPEEHFEVVLRHAGELVLRTEDEQRFFEACRALHDESWWRRYRTERRARTQRRIAAVLIPTVSAFAGWALGQAPVNFTTLRVAEVRATAWLGIENAQLAGADLRMAPLSGVRLVEADLSEADLRHATLSRAILEGARLRKTHLEGANLNDTVLMSADLSGAQLWGATFHGADLRGATVRTWASGADFTGALYDGNTDWGSNPPPDGALGPGGTADYARLHGVDASGKDLFRMQLIGAVLEEADLSEAVLLEADLTEVQARNADFTRADLGFARLARADLRGAELAQASLSGAILIDADLRGASLVGADLQRAQLDRARLDDALADARTAWPRDFDPVAAGVRVFIPGADLHDLPLREVRLAQASLVEVDLSGSDLSRADLEGADLSKANLERARLSGAHLAGARLDGAWLCGADLSNAVLTATTFTDAHACATTIWPGPVPQGVKVEK